MTAWQSYSPTKQQPWTADRAVHLHRRAVFGATWSELQRDAAGSPQDAVSRVLAGEVRAAGVPAEFSKLADLIGNSAAQQSNIERLKAWWIYRVLFSPDPLRERLTLMWHSHFATSNLKVDSLPQMKGQNESLRAHATGTFADLLNAMLRDPALLRWLDAETNRRGHANENLGRELLELFTLGIGNYTESDVKHAARALTGLSVKDGQFVFDAQRHDDGRKTILGQTGSFDPDQLATLLVSKPATAQRLADRLIGEFFGSGVVNDAARDELATRLSASQLDIGKAVETILRSQLFFSDANINNRICDPMTFLIAPLRALEMFEKPPSTLGLSEWLRRMGLDLFYPPNVAGWPGGRTWLTTRTIIARANYAAAVVSGEVNRPTAAPDVTKLARKYSAGMPNEFEPMIRTLLLGGATDARRESTQTTDAAISPEAGIFLNLMTETSAHLH